MQFILFGTIATCVLDIVHARITIILRVMHKLLGDDFDTMQYYYVFMIFLVMHVMVVLGIYAKISQENMSGFAIGVVVLILSTQVAQNFVFLLFQTWNDFNTGLVWHVLTTGIAFFLALIANGTAS